MGGGKCGFHTYVCCRKVKFSLVMHPRIDKKEICVGRAI